MVLLNFEYSEKELNLIEHFGFRDIAHMIDPIGLYRIMVCEAFKQNMQGPHVESLRRCWCALESYKTYRMTDEFDNLIKLD